MNKVFLIILFALVTISTSACQTLGFGEDLDNKNYVEIRFDDYPKYKFNAKKIEVVSKFMPTFTHPNIEHLMPVSIEKTAINWANDRLIANTPDSPYKIKFIIYDASVNEKDIIEETIIEADMIKYTARLDVSIRVTDDEDNILAETTSSSWREISAKKNSKIYSKEEIWYEIVQKLSLDFNEKIEAGIDSYLGQYILKPVE